MKNLDILGAWLFYPHDKWAIHFDFKLNSSNGLESEFSIDMWGLYFNETH